MDNKKISAELAKKLQAAKTPEDLQAVAQAAINAVLEQETSLESAQQLIYEQSQLLEKQRLADPKYRPEVKIGTKTVKIIHGVKIGDKVFSIADLEKDLKVVKNLVDSGSSAVKVIG